MTRQRAFQVEDLPEFEGRRVNRAGSRVAGAWPLDDMANMILGIGEVVDVVVTLQCVTVQHSVENSRGELVRVHQLRPMTVAMAPHIDLGAGGDGIVRATALELVSAARSSDESTSGHGR